MANNNEIGFEQFQKLVQEFDTAMLTTRGPDAQLHSRPMATQEPMDGSPLWFAATMNTGKIKDIQSDPHVNLGYFRPTDRAWVSIAGEARIDQDREKIKKLWKEDWRIWFPDGPEQADLVLLHVQPKSVTYWQPEHGRAGQIVEMATAYFTGKQPDMEPTHLSV